MIRRYEFVEGTSNKFWEIEPAGSGFTARWGRIGALGRNEKQYTFASAAEATKAGDKLVAEKLKKGYVAVGKAAKATKAASPAASGKAAKVVPAKPGPAKTNPKLEAMIADDPTDVGSWQVYADWLIENAEPWGEVIAHACRGKRPKAKQDEAALELLSGIDNSSITWKYGTIETLELCPEEDAPSAPASGKSPKFAKSAPKLESPMSQALARVLAHPAGRLIRALHLGLPPGYDMGHNFESVLPKIMKAGPLPLLHTLDLTRDAEHMDQDSWRSIGDLRALWKAAPRLKTLRLKGSGSRRAGNTAIAFGTIDAPHLETLFYESSGLDKTAPREIGKATLPALRHLELMLGRADYGNTGSVKDLAGILSGKGLPKLEYLALANSEWETDLVAAVASSAILPRLSVLDLSKGVLFNDGCAALVQHAASFRHLKKLDLDDNFLLPEHVKAIKKVIPCAAFGSQREIEDFDDDEVGYRYTSIGE